MQKVVGGGEDPSTIDAVRVVVLELGIRVGRVVVVIAADGVKRNRKCLGGEKPLNIVSQSGSSPLDTPSG